MSFIDIKDPKKRDQIVADYIATIRRVQQRNEDEKAVGLAKQAELNQTFNPIVQATKESTKTITEHLNPIHDELKNVSENIKPVIRRKRTWTDGSDVNALDFYLNSNKNQLDKYFGIWKDDDGRLFLGDKEVFVDDNSNIVVDNQTYHATSGLWSLIMLASPTFYTENDLETYKELSAQTNLMLNPSGVGKGSRPNSTAKRRLLEELHAKEGFGIVYLPGDINSLTEKLHLLLAEFRAGNTTTRNEIVSILDELLRRKRMSRKEYTEINNFLQK